MKLQNYSVMPLIPEKIGEICDDIERQVKERICSVPLFMMTLVPVGTPPRKEAEYLCESFDLFRDRLAERGIAAGILVQASLGHDGRHLPEPSPFTKLVRLSDGVSPEICCPADPAFRAHFRAVFRTLASHRPSVIMLDDDYRLMARPGRGCACERHMAEFNRRAGTSLTREQLWEHISEKGANDPLTKIYIQTQIDSLIDCVREMRAGVDEIDPKIPGAYCTCGNSCEGAAEIASILAGEGNPSVVRLNNANYTSPGARFLSRPFLRAAYQREALGGRADVLLAETDTCPQLRYSTSASMLHAHFSGSILEGARGAKQWITDLENADIRDGEAYRRILAKYAGFYEALADLEKDVTPVGCRIPLSSEPSYYYSKDLLYQPSNGAFFKHAFAQNVLERLGLPLYFSSKAGGVAFLDGDIASMYTKEEMDGAFSGTTVMDAAAARSFAKAGYGDKIGVTVEDWTEDLPDGDTLVFDGLTCREQVKPQKLVPNSDGVTVDSVLFKQLERGERLPLGPGTTRFARAGGETVVFAGTPDTAFSLTEAFSFLSAPRKKQLLRILRPTGCLPVYYPGDAEVYLRAGTMPDGALFCAFFNIGLDVIDGVELTVDRIPSTVSHLTPDGSWETVPFTVAGDTLTLSVRAEVLIPEIFLLR
ncbi:MAG: hypothetical protein IK090_07065 [Clostridia bacterium]|nr:hypothetical protein [Clostridia bacterium]